jgi:putative transposase
MPRIARVCAAGYPHHITQRGNNKEKVFSADEDRRFYLEVLQRYGNKHGIEILAYCLMGNHVHILGVPDKDTSLAKGIGGTNLMYTQYINRKYNRSGRLWQNRFFSAIVEEEPYLWAVMRYIEQNPVRAKIVKRAEEYQWSSAMAHVIGIKDDVLSRQSWFNDEERREYEKLLRQQDDEIDVAIRRATSTGRPLGSEGFIRKLKRIVKRDLIPRKGGRPKRKA